MMEQEPMLRDKCLHSEYKPPLWMAVLVCLLRASHRPASAWASLHSESARSPLLCFCFAALSPSWSTPGRGAAP